jgi:hypothetical protein
VIYGSASHKSDIGTGQHAQHDVEHSTIGQAAADRYESGVGVVSYWKIRTSHALRQFTPESGHPVDAARESAKPAGSPNYASASV